VTSDRVIRSAVIAAAGSALLAVVFLGSAVGASSGARLTTVPYDRHATRFCEKARHRLSAVPGPTSGNLASLAASIRAEVKIERAEVKSLKRLSPPTKLTSLVKRGMKVKARQIAIMTSLVKDATNGTLSFQKIFGKLLAMPQDTAIWRKVGAPVCQY
jgi:hypothetical protein